MFDYDTLGVASLYLSCMWFVELFEFMTWCLDDLISFVKLVANRFEMFFFFQFILSNSSGTPIIGISNF